MARRAFEGRLQQVLGVPAVAGQEVGRAQERGRTTAHEVLETEALVDAHAGNPLRHQFQTSFGHRRLKSNFWQPYGARRCRSRASATHAFCHISRCRLSSMPCQREAGSPTPVTSTAAPGYARANSALNGIEPPTPISTTSRP